MISSFETTSRLSSDLVNTIVLFAIAAILALGYAIRVHIKGRAQYDRTNNEGGSSLLKKELMEMVYWGLQPVAKVLVFLGATPNFLSWMSFAFGALTGTCLAFGHFGFGAAFGTVSALLDSLDGLVARMTKKSSDAGEVLDASIDRYVEFFFLGGLAIYYREFPVLLILVLAALLGSFMVSYSTAKAEALQVTPPRGNMRRTERALYLILGAWLSPITIPWLEFPYTHSIALGYPMILALGLVAVLSNVSAAERLVAIAKAVRCRDLKASQLPCVEHKASQNSNDEEMEEAPVEKPLNL